MLRFNSGFFPSSFMSLFSTSFSSQFATNVKMVCDNWNISTALWLRRFDIFSAIYWNLMIYILGDKFLFSMFLFRTVYERWSRHRTLAVFIMSSFWHGFYPGYYMMFLSLALMIEAGRMASVFVFFSLRETTSHLLGLVHFFASCVTLIYSTARSG